MSRRAALQGAINQAVQVVPDYGPDPRGTAMFGSLASVAQLGISGHDGQVFTGDKGSPEKSFNGDLGENLQAFTGAAALAMYGAARPIIPGSATFETTRSIDALDNMPSRVFAARAARKGALR